ncbi:hypothetical protein HYH02_012806 [Chlamydomonas schloesseri]|uniref:Fungal lipase-type domain-containing protein n=1 Tax=Chlamydomonas schloesseri TaxID=2026947 RepID=A0A835SU17_9CHLO|nr:hypothetical protein HYH02_012806 [Chlamydomonas schloesseri]|eukprot:KAG2433103.1 hypothetical protein HYH02_012806 [Chlamydomonas schloesseri]
MPLLQLRPTVAGRAAWPAPLSAVTRPPATSRLLLPPMCAALRHVFRDRSMDSVDDVFSSFAAQEHQQLPAQAPAPTQQQLPAGGPGPALASHVHPPRRHSLHVDYHRHMHTHGHPHHHRKGLELSDDWRALYLGARLAAWSGLCYLPQPELEAGLAGEGLQLVAYGRTAYTCWYVADGVVDFDALQRRAQPPPPGQRSSSSAASAAASVDADSNDRGGGGIGAASTSHHQPTSHKQQHPHPHPHPHHAVVVKDGRIHLHQPAQPHLHLPTPLHDAAHQGAQTARAAGKHTSHISSSGGRGAGGDAARQAAPPVPPAATSSLESGTSCRFIFLRGVQWSAPETNTLALSTSLASFWPVPLVPPAEIAISAGAAGTPASDPTPSPRGSGSSSTSGPASEHLVAHSGVAAMARELYPVLLPHIRSAGESGAQHVVFAGHSMGGSLAKLTWATAIMRGVLSPAAASCHTFGSPPVLAHSSGGGGARALRLLRAPPAACVNWVLEHDPIPRAMLTADPYLTAARKAVPGLSALLALRGAVLGEGAALSSGRFLYETLGETMLLRWSSKGGCEVVPVSEADAETLLQMAVEEALSAPIRSLQYWLDHHHASYHHDLEAAALAACRRGLRQQAAARQAVRQAAPGPTAPGGGGPAGGGTAHGTSPSSPAAGGRGGSV